MFDTFAEADERAGAVDWGRGGEASEGREAAAALALDIPPLVDMNAAPDAPAPLRVIPIGGKLEPMGIIPALKARPAVGVVRPLEHGLFVPLAGLLLLELALEGGTAVLALEKPYEK